MANELSKVEEGLVSLVDKGDLGDILKPLVKEIYLFDSHVAGTTHLEDDRVLSEIKVNDYLNLQRENNKYDENAIMLLSVDGKKVGYVPEKDNIIFARLMDAGKLLKAKISSIEDKKSFKLIHIGIYLVDF